MMNTNKYKDYALLAAATFAIFLNGPDLWCLEKKMKLDSIPKNLKYWLIGVASSITLFFLLGIPTDVVPNPWFMRMIEVTTLDYVFLTTSSVLLGAYIGIHYYKKHTATKCEVAAYSGGIGSFLAFGCPVCNKILILLFGATALMTYLEPYRPFLGFTSVAVLGGAVYWRVKQ